MPEAKQQKKPRRWRGRLAQKIRPQIERPIDCCAMTDDQAIARANATMINLYTQAVEKEYEEKLELLAKYYGTEPGDYRSLALKLSNDLPIPGFKVEPTLFGIDPYYVGFVPTKQKGRPKGWPTDRLLQLYCAVKDVRIKTGYTDREALKYLIERQPKEWGQEGHHRESREKRIKTLQNRLCEAKKRSDLYGCEVEKHRKILEIIRREVIEECSRDNPGN